MLATGRLHPHLLPTQLVGAAIQATMYILPTAKGTFYLARAVGFEGLGQSLSSVLIVACACWLFLFLQFFPGATSLSAQNPPRWPKFARTLADPTISIGEKFKAILTDWLSLLIIVSSLVWVASSVVSGVPLLQ
jgi:hypothetical protein